MLPVINQYFCIMYDLQHERGMLKVTAVKIRHLNYLQSLHVYVKKNKKKKQHKHISQTHHFLIPYLLSVLLVQLHLEDQDLPVEIIPDRKTSKIIRIKGQLQLSL